MRLRQSRRDRLFLLAAGAAAVLFIGGLLWLLLLFAPPAAPCPPPVAGSEVPCAFDSIGLQRGWPLVDLALGGLVGLGLAAAVIVRRWRQTARVAISIDDLVRDVLARER
jgi:hypothetical protein